MNRTIALVSCVKQKQSTPCRARFMYTSALFVKSASYAARATDHWWILSAKYGLLHPDCVIEPYELTLNDLRAADRRNWASHVLIQMQAQRLLDGSPRFLWLAGATYQRDLAGLLAIYPQTDPLRGKRIGERLAWLNTALR